MNAVIVNEEQARLWNGASGAAWIDEQQALDRMFRPFEESLVAAATSLGARRVLDVGCGTGATTLALARAGAEAIGIDISQPMIERARTRAAAEDSGARFVVADAQTQVFSPGDFDLLVSRFGVMFFGDPVAAFANLRRAARAGGALRAQVFRSPAENPFMTAAERAAAPLIPNLPPRKPGAPGQFAFADAARVRGILESAGWSAVDMRPLDVRCVFPEEQLEPYLRRLGPVAQVLRDADEATRSRVLSAIRSGFAPYLQQGEVRFTAACWEIAARA